MDANPPGAVLRRKSLPRSTAQRLIGMLLLLCCMLGLLVVSPLASRSSTAYAAGGIQINAGGPAVSPFAADTDFTGGGTSTTGNTVALTGVTNPAPESVYQSSRVGTSFSYAVPNLTAGASYTVRLHLCRDLLDGCGQACLQCKHQ